MLSHDYAGVLIQIKHRVVVCKISKQKTYEQGGLFRTDTIETLPGFEARDAFAVNSASVFREDLDIIPAIIDI